MPRDNNNSDRDDEYALMSLACIKPPGKTDSSVHFTLEEAKRLREMKLQPLEGAQRCGLQSP